MSANVQSMIYVGEKPWHGLGKRYDVAPNNPQEIISGASLDWKTASQPMRSELYEKIPDYQVIYREDNNDILGVIDKPENKVKIVQNAETFNAISSLLGKEMDTETAASLDDGRDIFGCFKIRQEFNLVDDKIDHYLVIINNHLRPDGKVTIVNTPVRVVCENTLTAALNNNLMKYRVNCTQDSIYNDSIASFIRESVMGSQKSLTTFAEKLLKQKITREHVEKLLDELFPYIKSDGPSIHERANETTSMVRETFLSQCMGADNLSNYAGTQYQVFNALTDFTQHYYMSSESGVDLQSRMKQLPGISSDWRISKYLKLAPKLVA